METEIMEIIANGGDARSASLKALKLARSGELDEAYKMLAKANTSLTFAHKIQTKLIQSEIRGEVNGVSLFMVHAQDHLMNAMTVKDLVVEIIEEIKNRIELEKRIEGVINND